MSTVGHDPGTLHCIIDAAPAPARMLASLLISVPLAALGDVVVPSESVESSVNIRAAADESAEVIAQLRPGDSVELVASVEHWHEVALADGLRGFISSDWTDVVDDEAADAPTAETAALETATRGATDTAEEAPVTADGEEAGVTADDGDGDGDGRPALADARDTEVPEPAAKDAGDADAEPEAVPPRDADADSSSTEPIVTERRPARGRGARTSQSDNELTASAAPGSNIEGTVNYLTKFTGPTTGGDSQVFDDGINVGIGTTEPEEPLDVNGNLQIYNRNSNLAVVSLRQASGDAGYITHNLAGTMIIGAGSEDRITIQGDGNIGVGTSRAMHPLEMASGAHVTAGGVWTNASSRDSKQDIEKLSLDEAIAALDELTPVLFSYKVDPEDTYVGFIAEDAPELVASKNRRGLSAMDIVAVLTRVVQAQQQRIEELESRLDASTSASPSPDRSLPLAPALTPRQPGVLGH